MRHSQFIRLTIKYFLFALSILLIAFTLEFLMEGNLRAYSWQAVANLLSSYGSAIVISVVVSVIMAWGEKRTRKD